jgi:threonine dehydratase
MPVPAYVVVPSNCPAKKINAARSYNASVFLADAPPNRVRLAAKISDSTGAVLVPPADHVDIVLGQATAVRELLQQVADMGQRLDAIVVPSGGGGLLVGAVTVCASQGVAVFGAEPEHGGPGLALALQTGQRCVEVNGSPTIADGLRSVTGEANWEHISRKGNVKGAFTVTEEQIKEALRLVVEEMGVLIEPSAAVGVAVALFSPGFAREMARFKGCARIGVLTGANIGVTDVLTLIPNMEMDSVLQK